MSFSEPPPLPPAENPEVTVTIHWDKIPDTTIKNSPYLTMLQSGTYKSKDSILSKLEDNIPANILEILEYSQKSYDSHTYSILAYNILPEYLELEYIHGMPREAISDYEYISKNENKLREFRRKDLNNFKNFITGNWDKLESIDPNIPIIFFSHFDLSWLSITIGNPLDFLHKDIHYSNYIFFFNDIKFQKLDISNLDIPGIICRNTQFEGEANFSYNQFKYADFRDTKFKEKVRFNKTTFNHITNFSNTEFFGDTSFVNTQFKYQANFETVKFHNQVEFRAEFEQEADFTEAIFKQEAFFQRTKFKQYTNFKNAIFQNNITFEKDSTFQNVNFIDTTFQNNAIFNSITFKHTDFTGTIFKQKIDFKKATFEGNANFTDTTFEREANFREANFQHEAYFTKAIFEKEANFYLTTFKQKIDFTKATFEKNNYFNHTTFHKEANFYLAKFKDVCNLDNTTFYEVPNFRYTSFFLPPRLHGIEIGIEKKKKIYNRIKTKVIFLKIKDNRSKLLLKLLKVLLKLKNKLKINTKSKGIKKYLYLLLKIEIDRNKILVQKLKILDRLQNDLKLSTNKKNKTQNTITKNNEDTNKNDITTSKEDKYRALKEMAIKGNDHENELRFYGYELNERMKNNKWCKVIPIWSYKITSNYGQSILRPLVFLGLTSVILFFTLNNNQNKLEYTLKTILPILGELKDSPKENNNSYLFLFKIPSFLFIFLLGLGIRNRFKIK